MKPKRKLNQIETAIKSKMLFNWKIKFKLHDILKLFKRKKTNK